jgi:hypothetical protein
VVGELVKRAVVAGAVAALLACGGRLLPEDVDAAIDAGGDVADAAPRFCDGATPSQACADPACRSQFIEYCEAFPPELYVGNVCRIDPTWATCLPTPEGGVGLDGGKACPDGYRCAYLVFQWDWDAAGPTTDARDVSCFEWHYGDPLPDYGAGAGVCWPNP